MIIKVEAYSNGAHANQSITPEPVPDGWAVVPDGMAIPDTFPFVNVSAENGVVTGMTAGTVPEPETEPEPEPSTADILNILLGVG